MTRRKITIEEAFAVFEEKGLKVTVQAVTEPVTDTFEPTAKAAVYGPTRVGNATVKVTLYAKHSIGSGGTMAVTDGDKTVEHAGVQSYGPGVTYVPAILATHLLHQDALARQADERMLDKQQRCYIVAPRIGPSGQRSNLAIQVNESMFDNMSNLPASVEYIIR